MKIAAVTAVIAFSASAAAGVLPPGGKVDKAVTANLTPDGIDFLLDQGIGLLPDQIAFPPTTGTVDAGLCDFNYDIYQGIPANGVNVNITSASVTPQQGYFQLAIAGVVSGTGTDVDGENDSHTFVVTRMQYAGCGTNCDAENWSVIRLTPTNFAVNTELDLQLLTDPNTGEPYVEATTTLDRDDISLSLNGLDAAGCASIDVLVALLKNFLTDQAKDLIIDQVNDTLLPAIEDGFQSLRYDDVVTFADSGLHIKLLPSALDIRPNGVAVSMSSQIEAVEPTTCVPIDPGAGAAFTPGEPPAYGTFSPGGNAYHAAASISDDFVSQALFATWHSGLLCQTISSTGDSDLTIDMLALAGLAGPLNRLGVEDGAPMLVVIKGYEPPTAAFADDPHLTIGVKRLEVSIFTTVADRTARIVALDLEADAGANIVIDAANVLSILLDIAPEDVTGVVSYDEMISGEDAATLIGLLPVLLEQFLPTLTDSLPTVDLGSLAGVGLQNPEFLAEQGVGGVENDTLSAYTGLVATGACGVGGTGSGCGVGSTGGCAMGGRGAATQAGFLVLAAAPIAVVLRRRRARRDL